MNVFKSIWRKLLEWLRGKQESPVPAPAPKPIPVPADGCTCDLSKPIIAPPPFCFLEGENETTLQDNPDLRFLIGNRKYDNNWKFFGRFAVKNKMYSFKDGKVLGFCKNIDGVDFHCCGQRQAKSASEMLPNVPTQYKKTHRIYWEPH